MVCPDVRLRHDKFEATCIGSLFLASPARNDLCGIKVRSAPNLEARENGTGNLVVVSSSNKTTQWRVHCRGTTADEFAMVSRGANVIKVPEGCVAYGDEMAYENLPRTILFESVIEEVGQPDFGMPSVLACFDDWAHVERTFAEFVTGSEAHEYHDASALSDALARKKLEALERHAGHVGSYGLGTAVAIVVTLAVVAVIATYLLIKYRARRTAERTGATRMTELGEGATKSEERIEMCESRTAALEAIVQQLLQVPSGRGAVARKKKSGGGGGATSLPPEEEHPHL
jgi:hypothetical protein